jgi:hypothetical protein
LEEDNMTNTAGILPMKVAGTEHLIDRTYRESGAYQWVRETFINARQAAATRIEFGIEWQAVEAAGVYRRTIADNGGGMSSEELVGFFNTFGGGGKPIGGVHENFGVGAKTSLFPWNRHGVVVVSWKDGDAAMIWMRQEPETGQYGLRLFEAEDDDGEVSLEAVVEPFDDPETGVDWSRIKPDWIDQHGTVIVLLGHDPSEDTVHGDVSRDEGDIKGISSYLNRRIWDIPPAVRVSVDELRSGEKATWPRSEIEGHGKQPTLGPDRRTNTRQVMGARHFIEYPASAKGHLQASGTVTVEGGTEIDWYLWSGDRPAIHSYAAMNGFCAALYEGELYDVSSHPSTYRSFGISEHEVRKRIWLVVRPPMFDEVSKRGVYPRTDRNALLLKGGPSAGEPLPIADWAAAFADQMPEQILDAIRTARSNGEGTITDNAWRDRLAERFGSLWRLAKLRAAPTGTLRVAATQQGSQPSSESKPRPKKARSASMRGNSGRAGQLNLGSNPGPLPASKGEVAGGIPTYLPSRAEDIGEAGMLAVWQPKHPNHPEGAVLINIEHPVLEGEIRRWQMMYPDHLASQIAEEVIAVYGEIAVSKVAHSEHLKGIIPTLQIDRELRSPAALTMSLLGLMAEEAVLATRIGGKFGRRKVAA